MPAAYWNELPDDDSSEELDDREYPDADPWQEDDADTRDCPACGAEIYADTDRCPVCGEFVTADTNIWSDKPRWWIALGVLGLIALTAALILGF